MSTKPLAREDDVAMPAPPCIADEIREIKDTVRNIHTAIIGAPELGQRGIIPRLITTEKKLDEHDKKFIRWGAVIGTSGMAFIFIKDALIAYLGMK